MLRAAVQAHNGVSTLISHVALKRVRFSKLALKLIENSHNSEISLKWSRFKSYINGRTFSLNSNMLKKMTENNTYYIQL